MKFIKKKQSKIHEEKTKEITTVAEVLNRQEICLDLHKL